MNKPATFCLALAACVAAVADSQASSNQFALENRFVRREFALQEGVWRTVRFSRADGTDELDVRSDEFLIRLSEGAELTVGDFRCVDDPLVQTDGVTQNVIIRYVPRERLVEEAPTQVVVEYRLSDEPYLRKRVTLSWLGPVAVPHLEVERFRTKAPCSLGGEGQPVFLGRSWFVGLEYPGSEAGHEGGLVTLAHFPGPARPDELADRHLIQSQMAVAGVGHPGDPLELAFSDYLDTIRRPSRILLHYNSWYDLRTNELTPETLVRTFEDFKRSVLDPFGLRMHAFVPDDGWQNPQSIWVPRSNLYPEGFGPLRGALESRGTRLGLWLPFNGFNLDVAWGAERGYERSNQGRYYCLVGPKYNAAIRGVAKRLVDEGNIGYFKHDFNQLRCSADGHGHLPADRHGRETNLNAQLGLLAYERELQPDVYLNVTSYVWHSPWWLRHADTIWMAAGDFGYNHD
ncbi:MAG: alpha-galactosidase, partial [Planctomycetota bacterium]